jgi:uncharacterized protein
LIVYDAVFTAASKGFHDKEKTVVIVGGWPGTGKSVIARCASLRAWLVLDLQ